jgi:hypothetical protein
MELKEERWFDLSAKWKDKIKSTVVCSLETLLLFRLHPQILILLWIFLHKCTWTSKKCYIELKPINVL